MNDRMRDYIDRRMNRGGGDGRNPYGSRGGYVTSRRPRRGDRAYEDQRDYGYDSRDYNSDYGYDSNYDSGYDRGYQRDRGYDRNYDRRYRRDYGEMETLSHEDLKHWKNKLRNMIVDSAKKMLTDENIIKSAKEMGMKFEAYSEDEYIVTVLMMYTDYWKAVGKGNVDMYLKLADCFLCDEDAAVMAGEKLAAYYECIVEE